MSFLTNNYDIYIYDVRNVDIYDLYSIIYSKRKLGINVPRFKNKMKKGERKGKIALRFLLTEVGREVVICISRFVRSFRDYLCITNT